MSNLKSIVPPVELCKLIPEGEFEGSVFAWRYPAYDERNRRLLNGWEVIEVNWYAVKEYKKKYDEREKFFPAPTMEEIRRKLLNLSIVPGDDVIHVECKIDPENWVSTIAVDENDVTAAALRLWFKVKGIEVE